MKVLVLNCSPKGDMSDCLKISRAFLEGLCMTDPTTDIIYENLVDKKINHCFGCYSCWAVSPGICCQDDDVNDLLTKITSADLVIWSTPLYCFGFPSIGKALIDRLLPLTCPEQKANEDGTTYHPDRQKNDIQFMLIRGCGFPNIKGNYDALLLQFEMLFARKDYPRIICVEAPLLSIEDAKPLTIPYLEMVRKAGSEFASNGKISEYTMNELMSPMLPADVYRSMTSSKDK